MAIDARIALGVQPVQQQPNMLEQYAQVMGIKAAQQEMEGNNALREAYASGGDLNDPEFRRRVMAANPKVGSQLIKTNAETGKLQNEAILKRIELSREMITGINTAEDYLAWHESNHKDPVLGSYLNQRGVTAEQSRAKIIAALNTPGGLEKLKRESALGATALQKELMQTERSVQVAGIGAGATMRGQDLLNAREIEKREYERLNPSLYHFTAPDGTLMVAPQRGGGAARPVPMDGSSAPLPPVTMGSGSGVAPAGAGSSIMVNPSAVNNLAPVNQNSLITQPQPTFAPAAPVNAQVRAVPVTKDVLDPTDPARKRMITVEVNSYVAGTGLGADGNAPPPKGVLGVAGSPIPSNYMPDPKNPQGVIPVPGSPADPNANLQIGYRQRADGTGQEFIPGGPADPKVIANRTTVTLSAKDKEAREAKYPQATSALKAFNAKTDKFDSVITELLANEKGLNEITGFFAGRTDLSAMSKEARRAFALFNTITAKGGFSELQDMRNASPTGGALGNVSNQEGGQLIASFGALTRTQDGDDVRKSLTTAQNDLRNLKERMGEAYDLTYEYRKPADGGFIYLGKE